MKPVFPNALPEQICRFPHRAITVGKRTWQYLNRCFSSALHAQKPSDLFYKNHPMSGFHPAVHQYITECFKVLLWYPIIEYQGWFFCICSVFSQMTCRHLPLSWHARGHLEHLWMQQMQWRDRLAQRDSCRTMDWPNYFPIDFLASWVAQDLHE